MERYSTRKEVTAEAQARSKHTVYRFVLLNRKGVIVGEIQHIATPGSAIVPFASGRRVHQDNADIDLVRQWFTQCHRSHGVFCEESGKVARNLPRIRVIDVQKNLIVEAPSPCPFMALSYVWGGKTNFALLNRKDLVLDERGAPFAHLPRKLPQTIADAIQLCSLLEERYIWIDSLCIVQDSVEDKKTQMQHMDAIYNSAFVTIVDASGTGADDGLAGISRSRSKAQKGRLVKGDRYAVPLPAYMDVLSDPSVVWNTRGWTFQEKVLSKRMLVFADSQVYFQCSNMVWYEDTVMETEGLQNKATINWRPLRWAADRTPHSPQDGLELGAVAAEYFLGNVVDKQNADQNSLLTGTFSLSDLLTSCMDILGKDHMLSALKKHRFANDKHFGQVALVALNRISFATYILAIQEYKGRDLTSQADGVNAIHGVLKTLSEQWGAFHSGLPESYLGAALLWGPSTHGTIKQYSIEEAPFPSWSWARWSFPQGIAWQTPKPSQARLASRAFLVKPSGVTELSSASFNPAPWFDEEPPEISYNRLSYQARRHLDIVGELLYMNCAVIRVQVGGVWRGSSETADGTINDYHLKLQNGDIAGYIRMSVEERDRCQKEVQEMVTVCWETGYDGPDIANHLIPTKVITTGDENNRQTRIVKMSRDEYPTASVFLVRWKNEIAERIALGHIVGKPWESCIHDSEWMLLG